MMPPKVRELKATLSKAGFFTRSRKGSHTVWYHPDIPGFPVTISGNDGRDAQPYQIKDVQDALQRLRRKK
jgi:predicted RNA binding protein YcfA (HicA-like mRNA interferase family)